MVATSDYFSALWLHWVALMSGVVGLLIGIGLRIGKRFSIALRNSGDIPDWAFIGVGALCLFWAGYLAWAAEHREAITALADLERERNNNKPKLVGKFLQTIGGDTADAKGAGAWLELQIVNQGTPSIVLPDSWRASVTTADGQIRKAALNLIRDGSQIHMADGKSFPIGSADAICETASTRAIGQGNIAHGWLELYFEGAKYQDLVAPGAKWEVRAEDVLGNPWIASFTYKGGERTPAPAYYPGSGVIK